MLLDLLADFVNEFTKVLTQPPEQKYPQPLTQKHSPQPVIHQYVSLKGTLKN
jgi:hypothetical protein